MQAVNLDAANFREQFREQGFSVRERVLPADEADRLAIAIEQIPLGDEVRRKQQIYGIRNLLEVCPAVCELANDPRIRQFAVAALGDKAFAVRAIFFDKVPGANWSLFRHQDNVIAVQEKIELPGFTAWSNKAGTWQVQPPAEVLANMIAVRVHLDDCGPDNGPLRVLPGSHRHGWIEESLDDWKSRVPEVVCTVDKGGIVTMCPLTLHASSRSSAAEHRRVIHFEFAAAELPGGLRWKSRIAPRD
jgi:hypothetical protein